jgi:hypothetical protein
MVQMHHPTPNQNCPAALVCRLEGYSSMKTKKAKRTTSNDAPNLTLKFRAECAADAHMVRSLLLPWLVMWREEQMPFRIEGNTHFLPGTVVQFTLGGHGPGHSEVLWLVDMLLNCHVIGDTLMPIAKYTGDRKFRRRFSEPAMRPSSEVIERAFAALQLRIELLRVELPRTEFSSKEVHGALTAPDAELAFAGSLDEPGWLFTREHKATGLCSVRSARAMNGDLDEMVGERTQLEARNIALEA